MNIATEIEKIADTVINMAINVGTEVAKKEAYIKELEEKISMLATYRDVNQYIGTKLEIEDLLQTIKDIVIGVLGVSECCIALLNAKENNNTYKIIEESTLGENKSIITNQKIIELNKELTTRDGEIVLRNMEITEFWGFNKGAFLARALKRKDVVFGLIAIYFNNYEGLNDIKIELFKLISNQLELHLENTYLIQKKMEHSEVIIQRERLVSLGQLMGGIAHNIKTPIMSISGCLEGLTDLIGEYQKSIGDGEVTNEDHKEIAFEMLDWISKIRPQLSYMSDVITTVKDQATNFSVDYESRFNIEELTKKVGILMQTEIQKNHCKLNINLNTNKYLVIEGEINNLVQAINNIISNAVYVYQPDGGIIDFNIIQKDKRIQLSITDYAYGIPINVQEKLFKEMVTTKGRNGTGLGMFVAYTTIKVKFGGDIWFETKENKGTTFYIEIPIAEDTPDKKSEDMSLTEQANF